MTFVQILASFASDGAGEGGIGALIALLATFSGMMMAAVGVAACKERVAAKAVTPRQQATRVTPRQEAQRRRG